MNNSIPPAGVADLERDLASLDSSRRHSALTQLAGLLKQGEITCPPAEAIANMHGHTFFSYNPDFYSPSQFAWLARRRGLGLAGLVDFDVLDGLEEFHEAGRLLELKTCVSIETRVFVPEFSSRVINSPGEPGIAYHMGVGFTAAPTTRWATEFLASLRETAGRRTRELTERVNAFLQPVELDHDRDVLPLTPQGNATERHLCLAYARKAAATFSDTQALAAFWADKLDTPADTLDLPEGPKLQAHIRARTMKRGGVGYVQPDADSFPRLDDMNRFALEAGAIPTIAWLDGTTDGEQALDEWMDVASQSGAAAINLIPDRNYTPGVQDEKLNNLYEVVQKAERRGFPIIVGTELNGPGQKFVDDFDSEELKPLADGFMKGAYITFAHTALQATAGMGYLSEWAGAHFTDVHEKNTFYAECGRLLPSSYEKPLSNVSADNTPDQVMETARKTTS